MSKSANFGDWIAEIPRRKPLAMPEERARAAAIYLTKCFPT